MQRCLIRNIQIWKITIDFVKTSRARYGIHSDVLLQRWPNLNWLVVEPTPLKNMTVKMGIIPNVRGENSKNIWVATCHHPGFQQTNEVEENQVSQNGNLPQIGGENKKYLKPPPESKPIKNISSQGTPSFSTIRRSKRPQLRKHPQMTFQTMKSFLVSYCWWKEPQTTTWDVSQTRGK